MEIRNSSQTLDLEHSISPILARQCAHGVLFDRDLAERIYAELLSAKTTARVALQDVFKVRVVSLGLVTPKASNSKYGTRKGCEYTRIKFEEYNPSSRPQTIDRLKQQFKWNPMDFTEKGSPKLDEEIIEALPFKEVAPLKEYMMVNQRLKQLSSGKSSFMKCVKEDGRIYGSIMQSGTVTGRMAHHCVPMTTKALTRNGWKTFEELVVGEDILAYDLKSDTKKWTPLLSKSKFEKAEIGRLYCGRRSFLCTANHRWVVKNKNYYLRDGTRCPGNTQIKFAKDIKPTHAILTNADYDNTNEGGGFQTVQQKYNYNYFQHITRMNNSELHAFLNGFLLADGCFRKLSSANTASYTWTFAQAEGEIFDLLLTTAYLASNTRISCNVKNIPSKTQREGHHVNITQTRTLRNREEMRWEFEEIGDVWCPETEYGTWVMRQGNDITITGNSPNMNVPRVDKPYGKEFRSLFTVPEGKIMIGCDADGLEARTLGGYIKKFDNGQFIRALLEGDKSKGTDIHSLNAQAFGVDYLPEGRDASKTLFYAMVYGAKNPKLGLILLTYGVNFQDYLPDFDNQLKGIIKWRDGKGLDFSDSTLECLIAGKHCRTMYGEQMPALPELVKDVTARWKQQGFLKGLDGRKLYPRSEHSVFNMLNQSAGAVIMKKALELADNGMQKDGLKPGRDYEFVLNVHDEWQVETTNKTEIIEVVSLHLPKAIKEAGEFFNFPCPMSGSVRTGRSWAETH